MWVQELRTHKRRTTSESSEIFAIKSQLTAPPCLRRSAPRFLPNVGDTEMVKLSPKRLDSFSAMAKVFPVRMVSVSQAGRKPESGDR